MRVRLPMCAAVPGAGLCLSLAAIFLLALSTAAQQAQQARLSIRITSPRDGEVVAGVTLVSAAVQGGSGGEKVSFYIDDRLAFVDPAAPYEYSWDSGPAPKGRRLRVAVVSPDGRRAEATVRTVGIDAAEAVDVKLRQISVTALDDNGNFVKDLEQADFVVHEDGARRQMTSFYKGDAPLSLVLLVDVSRSMLSGLRIEKSKRAAVEFLKSLRPQDNVMVIAFNHGVYAQGDFTQERQGQIRFIEGMIADGGTALYDTLLAAMGKLSSRQGRKVIVVFSDGRDEHSVAALRDATDELLRGDATLYAVGVGLLGEEVRQKEILSDWASQTGGRAFFSDTINDVGKFYAAISEELRWQYSIGFPPPETKRSWHEIRISLATRQGLRLRYKTGYLSR